MAHNNQQNISILSPFTMSIHATMMKTSAFNELKTGA